jgi:glutamate synthase (NADPH/NADH) large chain
MITLGCKYLRICHLNTCAVGVATQNKRLREEHFIGMPEMVMNYFRFLVEETREIMASLGARTLEELVGRVDLLELADPVTAKQANLDLSRLISDGGVPKDKPHTCQTDRNRPWDTGALAEQMLEQIRPSIEKNQAGTFSFHLINTARSIGARISGEIARHHGAEGMRANPIRLNLTGIAGQSFGVWNSAGLHMYLEGDANDYVGKGMAGGKLIVTPPKGSAFVAKDTPIVGNTCLYGATGGKLYADGRGGERFAVRNSGATAIVTGMGDHGCEYMTGGLVISLGSVGLNFGAGMSGGYAIVYDAQNQLPDTYNNEMVEICRMTCDETENFRSTLKQALEDYIQETQSSWAQSLMQDFNRQIGHFWLVKPKALSLDHLWKITHRAAD